VRKIFTEHAIGKIIPTGGIGGNCLLVTGMDEVTAADVRKLRGIRSIAAVMGVSTTGPKPA
jgi:hypothetical protein